MNKLSVKHIYKVDHPQVKWSTLVICMLHAFNMHTVDANPCIYLHMQVYTDGNNCVCVF